MGSGRIWSYRNTEVVGSKAELVLNAQGADMFVAKVTGSLVSTQKADSLVGHKGRSGEPYRREADQRRSLVSTGRTLVAVDGLGAGEGD